MRHVRVCGCSRGCAKPHKSQWCGLKLRRRKFFLLRFGSFPSTTSIFPTKLQRRGILITASAKPFGEPGMAKEGFAARQTLVMFSPHWGWSGVLHRHHPITLLSFLSPIRGRPGPALLCWGRVT